MKTMIAKSIFALGASVTLFAALGAMLNACAPDPVTVQAQYPGPQHLSSKVTIPGTDAF